MRYDAIIVGASFAGLSVAAELRGKRVLLLDRKPIGTGQTSACGTILRVLEALDATDSVLQVHERIIVHTARRDLVYDLIHPFCTFDYAHFCLLLADRTDADFVNAPAIGVERGGVLTPQGAFAGKVLIDASGWRAALASSLRPGFVRRGDLNFGMETVVEHRHDGLHFWYDPHVLQRGVVWLFPRGATSSIGIGSYLGETKLGGKLQSFMNDLGLHQNGVHGSFFPHELREPVVGQLFVVGDAAGQCLALTGEGIRPALYFGRVCGRLVRRVLDGELSREEGQAEYWRFVERHRHYFAVMSWLQRVLPPLPNSIIAALGEIVRLQPVLHRVMDYYERAMRLDEAHLDGLVGKTWATAQCWDTQ
ncbi:MAG: NAD(P)/FAD-dependent oxidoreductase [Anaerolineae bacterium]